MSVKFMRKSAVAVAATALLGGGLAVGVGQGVAGAEGSLGSSTGSAAGAECKTSNSVETSNLTITRKVVGDGTVAPGRTVTIATTVTANNTPDRYIKGFVDRYGDGLSFEYAEVDAWHVAGNKQKTERVEAGDNTSDKTVTIGGSQNWPATPGIVSKKSVTSYVTYRADKNLKPGDTIDTGASVKVSTFQTDQNIGDVCVIVRSPDPVEAAFGSLDSVGLGSVEGGIDGMTGSFEDPQGAISDIIGGIIGKAIRDGLGS